jgi:septum formation protein
MRRLILASQSPRRRELLTEAGYDFEVVLPHDSAECGICSRETPPEMVARLAWQKAKDVAERITDAATVIGCDTVAECCGQILGKPKNVEHAREMLRLLRGREHHVYSGLCLWHRPSDEHHVLVDVTRLRMDEIPDADLEEYLESGQWEGKAGAFGYQDRLGWIHVLEGSESNVVGLPLELLDRMLKGEPVTPPKPAG